MRPKVRRYLTHMGCSEDLAEDITADACLAILDRWDRLHADPAYSGKEPINYLYTIARREFAKRGPRYDRRRQREQLSESPSDETGAHIDRPDESARDRIGEALLELPVRLREVVWLRHVERFTTKETAAIMYASESKIKCWLAMAVKQLRRHYTTIMGEDSKETTP